MSGRLINSIKNGSKDFRTSHALIIGINEYSNGIRRLSTPVNDATRLASILESEHGYKVHLLTKNVSKERLERVLTTELPLQIGEDDRLLFYFAGHGVALDGDIGMEGFLVPQDANSKERDSLLPMAELSKWLNALCCRHMLAILDCCFAGAFRWAGGRDVSIDKLEEIHQERYERFIRAKAWQAVTSAAYDQEALDVIHGKAVGARGEVAEITHSPFALALYEALSGEADLIPKRGGDGVITTTELYLYLLEHLGVEVKEAIGHEQTPGLWPLEKHERGEYIFLTPGHKLNLPSAPKLTENLNPWRGLESYNYREEDSKLFFGREKEIKKLAEDVKKHSLTVVVGASGTGKSSLVKAGLLPDLAKKGAENGETWFILPPLRPGLTPLFNLYTLLDKHLSTHVKASRLHSFNNTPDGLANIVTNWREENPSMKLVLIIDQMEELVTLNQDEERQNFLKLLEQAIQAEPDAFRLIVTVRSDFEPLFTAYNKPLKQFWADARSVLSPLAQDDLRRVIEGPATVRVLYFESPKLVDTLINEVLQTPSALPLLSFTLSEMYLYYLNSKRKDRTLSQVEYDQVGGVIGSLRKRANEVYDTLPDHRETMRRVMLRMISIEGGELARRRVHLSELKYSTNDDNEENLRVQEVLRHLVKARLLVISEELGAATIEPAHDALVLSWDRLLRWKNEAEQYLLLQRRVTQATFEWNSAELSAQSKLLWDNDPRLPQLVETLWPTNPKYKGLLKRFYQLWRTLNPDKTIPNNTKWLNGLEIGFTIASVEKRAQFWQRAVTISLLIASIVVILVFRIVEANQDLEVANQGLDVANQDLEARLIQSRGQDILAQSPLEALILGVEGITTANSLDVKQAIINELLSDLQTGRVFMADNVKGINLVLGGKYLFIDMRDLDDALLSTETGEVISLSNEVHYGTVTYTWLNRTVRNDGFFQIGHSDFYIVDYLDHKAEVRSFTNPDYSKDLHGEIEDFVGFSNTETVMVDFVDQPGTLLTPNNHNIEKIDLPGELRKVSTIDSLPVLLVELYSDGESKFELRAATDGGVLVNLCDEPSGNPIVSDDNTLLAINYDNILCPTEVFLIDSSDFVSEEHADKVTDILSVPESDWIVVSYESMPSILSLRNGSITVTLSGSADKILTIKGAPYFIVNYTNTEAEMISLDDGQLHEKLSGAIESIASWPDRPFFVIDYIKSAETSEDSQTYDIFAVPDGRSILEGLNSTLRYRFQVPRNSEMKLMRDPHLPFLILNCAQVHCQGSHLILLEPGFHSIYLSDYYVKQIKFFDSVPMFGIQFDTHFQLRSINDPTKILANNISRDLISITPISPTADSDLFIFTYANQHYSELRWGNLLNIPRSPWRPCNDSIKFTEGIPWIVIENSNTNCTKILIHTELSNIAAKNPPSCRNPIAVKHSNNPHYFLTICTSALTQLHDMETADRIVGFERFGYSEDGDPYEVLVDQNGIASIIPKDEISSVTIDLGSGASQYQWIKEINLMAVRYFSENAYLIDPTLPDLFALELQQTQASNSDSTACEEQCINAFIQIISNYINSTKIDINWELVCNLVGRPLHTSSLQNEC